ncbi:hypothetical protein [Streptomyces sp. SD15]
MKDRLVIKGARRHNLRDISVTLPRDTLLVLTGESGSGKQHNRETLEVHFKDKSIADVLSTTIEESLDFFAEGAPGQVAAPPRSRTGQFLRTLPERS